MAVLFPSANVGRTSTIIAYFAEYVELFMRVYIADPADSDDEEIVEAAEEPTAEAEIA